MNNSQAMKLSRFRLEDFPLPVIANDHSKEERGVILVIGGSDSVPGAVKLAGLGALRAGAGKLQLATTATIATTLGIAVPEALMIGLAIDGEGELDVATANSALSTYIAKADAILVGPGMRSHQRMVSFIGEIIEQMQSHAILVIDGPIIGALADDDAVLHPLAGRAILTPHAGEMAALLEIPREEIASDADDIAEHCANRFGAAVVLKGSETWISAVDAIALCYRDGKAGLGTSGSGDVLAGVIAGLCARGAPVMTAAAWGVWAHGSAGNKLSRTVAPVGFLASEILNEIPGLLHN